MSGDTTRIYIALDIVSNLQGDPQLARRADLHPHLGCRCGSRCPSVILERSIIAVNTLPGRTKPAVLSQSPLFVERKKSYVKLEHIWKESVQRETNSPLVNVNAGRTVQRVGANSAILTSQGATPETPCQYNVGSPTCFASCIIMPGPVMV